MGGRDKNIRKAIFANVASKGSFIVSDIVESTGFSATTIAKYVDELVRDGSVVPCDALPRGGRGRNPIVYRLADESRYFLGVDIRNDCIYMMLMTVSGSKTDKEEFQYVYENSARNVEEICQLIDGYLMNHGVEKRQVLGSCLVIGGRINSQNGTSASRFWFEELGDMSFAEYMEERLEIPVMLENDSKAMAYAELICSDEKINNMLFINFSWGIGLGIVIDGKLYHGSAGYSGEFGHIHTYENNILCQCGKRGCLETEVSGSGIQRHLLERLKNGERSILAAKYKNGEAITMKDIIRACECEDEMCIDQITKAGAELGMKISYLINIFNPDHVFVGGILSASAAYYLMLPVESSIRKYSLKLISKGVPVRVSALGLDAGVIGGCMLARSRYLQLIMS